MIENFKIITLCGSTKFKDQFISEQKRLTLEGNIVISVGLFGHSGDVEVFTNNTKEMLDNMHKRKIDLADEIFVINVGGYIGESTKSEIKYAINKNKVVKYLENLDKDLENAIESLSEYYKNPNIDDDKYLNDISDYIDEHIKITDDHNKYIFKK